MGGFGFCARLETHLRGSILNTDYSVTTINTLTVRQSSALICCMLCVVKNKEI